MRLEVLLLTTTMIQTVQDDMLRGFRLLDGVDHDDDVEEYYNIRCEPDESIADFNRRT